ncbi:MULTISPECIES: TetR/AcrR family transcriptional regulator [Actinoalloteichus]|uniref:Transcriptional regulator, TetR family n=1 Tax=Actinoalloteichus fjordicus TaxID=1612552 RepID=A0AAC9LEZ1_9PSEU|nr:MULTISPECIES: TetR/AcrR family transcriptional regulator [Actinoalloteichus]APU15639.1 transcriptional regulator, TetR family [Actinoalloteichus fjordicus]APU21699.1 transcriptional regulator, TetR family [Actinoalloteichus sp. GBA129-24]
MTDDARQGEPRRQARGQRRIEQILHASATVFAEHGYEGATTNAIAGAAGISPGSLYQYFKNKDDIARALADHYAERLQAFRSEVLATESAAGVTLSAAVERVVGPLVAFNLAHPGFKSLFARTDMPAPLRAAVAPVQQAIHGRVAALIGALVPGLDPAVLSRTVTVVIQIVRGMIPLIAEASPSEQAAMTAELQTVLVSYLETAGRAR